MLKLQTECYKLLGVSKRLYLVFDLKRLKKNVSNQIADLCKMCYLFFTYQLLPRLKD